MAKAKGAPKFTYRDLAFYAGEASRRAGDRARRLLASDIDLDAEAPPEVAGSFFCDLVALHHAVGDREPRSVFMRRMRSG